MKHFSLKQKIGLKRAISSEIGFLNRVFKLKLFVLILPSGLNVLRKPDGIFYF